MNTNETDDVQRMSRSIGRSAAVLALAVLLAACSSGKLSNTPGKSVEMPGEQQKKAEGLVAPLYSKGGSSAQGKVGIFQRGDTWLLTVTLFGVAPGQYRMAFFDNGNCSSPNAFSAGKPWLPPGAPADAQPEKWIPVIYQSGLHAGPDDNVMRLPNPGKSNEEVFRKRSVLFFAGNSVEPLKPSVPNEVIACGVFDSIETIF